MQKPAPLSAEWEARVRRHYSHLFVRIILPMILLTAAFLLLSHWHLGVENAAIVPWALAGLVGLNAWLMWSWNDRLLTLKWCMNFLLVTAIAWGLHVHTSLTAVWVMLTFGALVEIRHQPQQWLIGCVAFASYCFLLSLFYPQSVWMWLYLCACYIGLVFIFIRLERYWQDEIIQLFEMQLRFTRMEKEAQSLQRDAAIGHSVRALTHEINNLIGVAAVSVEQLRHSPVAMPKDIDRLDRVLGYMSKVSALVLDGIGSKKSHTRLISLEELRGDVQLLLGNGHNHSGIALYIDFPPDADKYTLEERAGATYLIIHNLVKNAFEAVAEKFGEDPGGKVVIGVRVADNQLLISVEDNGIGLASDQVEAILSNDVESLKVNGYGLGLRFVQQECLMRKCVLHIKTGHRGTLLTVRMALGLETPSIR